MTVTQKQIDDIKQQTESAVAAGLVKVQQAAYQRAIGAVVAEIGRTRATSEHKAVGLAACEAVLARLVPPEIQI